MHSRFRQRIAETLVATKKKSGTEAAKEYAQRVHDGMSKQEWAELSAVILAVKKKKK